MGRLIVVGAGVIGLTVAWRAAQRGYDVEVVEAASPGAGASTVAAGVLSPTEEFGWEGEFGAENLRDALGWGEFAAELERASGLSIGYRRDGILHVALEDEDERRLRAVQAALAGLNYPNEWLDAEAARELEPALGPSVLGGLHLPAAASVETPRLRDALVVAARRAGVAFHAESEVVGLQRTDGTLTGVELAGGTTVAGERVVLCTGAASGLHPWLPPEIRPPVTPLKGELVIARAEGGEPIVRRIVRTWGGSIAARAGGAHVLGVTSRPDELDSSARVHGLAHIFNNAQRVVPATAELRIEEIKVGFRPATPDRLPVIGATALDGLYVCVGHGPLGILKAPGSAETCIAALTGSLSQAHPYSPARFG